MSVIDDITRLKHMLQAAQQAVAFARGKARTSLDEDTLLVFALVRAIEIVGEAASRITPEFRATYPQIPWQVIVGMRNVLVHAYFDVDLDIVWNTVTKNLPPLIVELQTLVNSIEKNGEG